MAFQFTAEIFKSIEKVLNAEFHKDNDCYQVVLENTDEGRKLTLEIYPDIPIGQRTGHLISVYTAASHLQLHFCSGFVISEMLGEVTFIAECAGKVSGLIIEKGAACSLYSNVDSDILSGDFTQLGPEVMLSGIALSLTEHLLPNDDSFDSEE